MFIVYNKLITRYPRQYVGLLTDWLCPSVYHAKKKKSDRILLKSFKHISQLENSHIIMYAYLPDANAVHSICNS